MTQLAPATARMSDHYIILGVFMYLIFSKMTDDLYSLEFTTLDWVQTQYLLW